METQRILAVMESKPAETQDTVVKPVASYEEAVALVTVLNDGIDLAAQPYYVGVLPVH